MSPTRNPDTTLALVAGFRTPFCKAGGALRAASAADLATHVVRELLDRTGVPGHAVDEVILGCAGPDPREANVARIAALRAGLPATTTAHTVMRNCGSGLEALLAAELRLCAGAGKVFVVGGTESMSNFPLLMGPELVRFFTRLGKAKGLGRRLAALLSLRPRALRPRIALLEGLTDPTIGESMGQTAERLAREFGIGRAAMDVFALQSQRRAHRAQQRGRFTQEIAALVPAPFREPCTADDGIRPEAALEALGRLRPVFDPRDGDVTVGNSCQITDGAVALLCMAESEARRQGLQPMALLRGTATAALDPAHMGLGPVHATPLALQRAGVAFAELDTIELNEAFAAQALACQAAFADPAYCRTHLGLAAPLGELDPERLNRNGGAIALGHPIAATGARLVLTLAHELRTRGARYGLATLCIGGGQGQAAVLEAA
ncbi:MAG: thiolase family protein [Planctomycetes bacterium]|nr:thiolase family protein [Planctomycetota bacterium]